MRVNGQTFPEVLMNRYCVTDSSCVHPAFLMEKSKHASSSEKREGTLKIDDNNAASVHPMVPAILDEKNKVLQARNETSQSQHHQ